MRAPEFWQHRGLRSTALLPAGAGLALAGRLRRAVARPYRASVPVVCVGNLVAGGAGKTPVVLDLATRLGQRGVAVGLLSRGYGGALSGPVLVDPARHDYRAVGDEPLLLAEAAPTMVAHDRAAGARALIAAGARLILLDDGLQNPGLTQDLRLVVIDGGYGFGNGRVMPAGPLREGLENGLARAHAAILIGADLVGAADRAGRQVQVLRANLVPVGPAAGWRDRPVVAFAGIGRPDKFFATLETLGARILVRQAFPDHHPYEPAELEPLLVAAAAARAVPVTTAKDWVRLPPALRRGVEVLRVVLDWATPEDAGQLDRLLAERAGLR